ncbi:MAG: hypothetical protein KAI47_03525, partial [Deltaproteobacteria bacterium]|nr:hypothetical protein [Deltaproteobacteria bacterium]
MTTKAKTPKSPKSLKPPNSPNSPKPSEIPTGEDAPAVAKTSPQNEADDQDDDTETLSTAIHRRDPDAIAAVCQSVLIAAPDNFIHRPWGGHDLPTFKKQSDDDATEPPPWGETFELAAHETDAEAHAHPSRIDLPDGSTIALPELLAIAGRELLGKPIFDAYGPNLPLLPKLLDVASLLSVQAHPPGYTEVYVIVKADTEATLRLGFVHDADEAMLADLFTEGRRWQSEFLALLGGNINEHAIQTILNDAFRGRGKTIGGPLLDALANLSPKSVNRHSLVRKLTALKQRYWEVLDLFNAIPAIPGQVVYNATPTRLLADPNAIPSAEVHALGNPEGRKLLALEIRRPTVTYRAWDHVRFPRRPIDVDRALGALNLRATRPEEFIVAPRPVDGLPGVFRSVEDPAFTLDHLRPTAGQPVSIPATEVAQTLHILRGKVEVHPNNHELPVTLLRGASALVPATLGAYQVVCIGDEPVELVRVTLRVPQDKIADPRDKDTNPRDKVADAAQTASRPSFLTENPVALRFGTS